MADKLGMFFIDSSLCLVLSYVTKQNVLILGVNFIFQFEVHLIFILINLALNKNSLPRSNSELILGL